MALAAAGPAEEDRAEVDLAEVDQTADRQDDSVVQHLEAGESVRVEATEQTAESLTRRVYPSAGKSWAYLSCPERYQRYEAHRPRQSELAPSRAI